MIGFRNLIVLFALSLFSMVEHSAADDTTGERDAGYTYVSNIEGYYNITMDYCDIVSIVHAGEELQEALDIFMEGKNSFRSATRMRFYEDWSSADHTGEKGYDGLMKHMESPDSLTDAVKEAIEAGHPELVEALMALVRTKYLIHEFDAALSKIQFAKDDETLVETMTDDKSGFPHNLDEAWAIWAHSGDCHMSDLASVARHLAQASGAMAGTDAVIHYMMAHYTHEITHAGKNAMYDYANATRDNVLLAVDAFLAQAAVSYMTYAETCEDEMMTKAADVATSMASGLLEVFYEGADEDHSDLFDAINNATNATVLYDAFKELLADQGFDVLLGSLPPAPDCGHETSDRH